MLLYWSETKAQIKLCFLIGWKNTADFPRRIPIGQYQLQVNQCHNSSSSQGGRTVYSFFNDFNKGWVVKQNKKVNTFVILLVSEMEEHRENDD